MSSLTLNKVKQVIISLLPILIRHYLNFAIDRSINYGILAQAEFIEEKMTFTITTWRKMFGLLSRSLGIDIIKKYFLPFLITKKKMKVLIILKFYSVFNAKVFII